MQECHAAFSVFGGFTFIPELIDARSLQFLVSYERRMLIATGRAYM